jgi:BirA family biotin operon repressor/biotin-[acetyl-CoA-carboxylase] ligase
VFAETQTRGRGRLGRPWQAPPGAALLCSTLWRPPAAAGMVQLCAVAARSALRRFGVEAELKWPNDLLLGRAKVGGVLIEAVYLGERLDFVVAGIGLNLLQGPDELPPTAYPATSVHLTTGRRIRLDGPGGSLVGRAVDVEPDGALLLELDDGRIERVVSGEVSARDP